MMRVCRSDNFFSLGDMNASLIQNNRSLVVIIYEQVFCVNGVF